jgi:Tfp pilus assembly protein PilX
VLIGICFVRVVVNFMDYFNYRKIHKEKGIATLPTVMVLGMLTLTVAVGITSVALTDSFVSQSSSQSSRALSYAEGGARDALLKISRNKNYSCATTDCYTIDLNTDGCTLGTGCAKVSVSSAGGDTANPKIITSKGVMNSSIRTIEVSVILDSGTDDPALSHGLITSTTWAELTN